MINKANLIGMDECIKDESWTLEISSKTGWLDINLSELWQYRDLIFLLIRRDFVVIYKQTILGPLWFIIQPLFNTLIFTIVFGNIAKIPTDGIPHILFYMSGTIVWAYFADCMTKTSNTFITNSVIFGKVYFPRLAVPIATVLTSMLSFFIQFSLFIVCLIYYMLFMNSSVNPTLWVFALPLLLLQMASLGLGMGVLISSLTTKYRDLTLTVSFGTQLWMYLTPIVYPLSQIPQQFQWIYGLNPMVAIIEIFRSAFLGSEMISLAIWAESILITAVILITGVMMFNKIEKTFMDTI